MTKERTTIISALIAIVLVTLVALLMGGCAVGARVVVTHAPRCEVQRVRMNWIEGPPTDWALNVCRYGAVGRFPDPNEATEVTRGRR